MKKCPKTIDRPILIFGLEVEDIAILAALSGAIMLFFDTFYGGMVFLVGWVGVKVIKRGKPQGYLTHMLYKYGFKIVGLIDPPKKISRYSAYSSRE